jgi:hypothetical protein
LLPSILPGFLLLFLGVSYPKWYFPVMGGSSPLSLAVMSAILCDMLQSPEP